MTITQQKLESLGMNRLRELAHALEFLHDIGHVVYFRDEASAELAAPTRRRLFLKLYIVI